MAKSGNRASASRRSAARLRRDPEGVQEFLHPADEFTPLVQIVSMEGPVARAIPWVARALSSASPRRATCRRPVPMKEVTTRYVGMDVHKATISVAVADEGVPPIAVGTIANHPGAVRKLVSQLKRGGKLVTAYEAGPTGYGLHRQLVDLGVDCVAVAPALIPRRAGDRVKT